MSKRILVHGSIAIDYIMEFSGNLYDNVFVDNDSKAFSMAVMPESKKMQFGGTAGNISHNLGLLGAPCEVVTSVGVDFITTGYQEKFSYFKNLKLNLNHYNDGFCANCYIVNDNKKQQLIVYHGGVTQRLPKESLSQRGINAESISWAINSPENPIQMTKVSEELHNLGINSILDTGQVTPAFSSDQLKKMIRESNIMICNENEFHMILEKTGYDEFNILNFIDTIIMTKGSKGSFIYQKDKISQIPIVSPKKVLDPTGAGDGYRAGLLYALHQGLSIEEGCKIGATVGSFVVETIGGQTQSFSKEDFKSRYESAFSELRLELF